MLSTPSEKEAPPFRSTDEDKDRCTKKVKNKEIMEDGKVNILSFKDMLINREETMVDGPLDLHGDFELEEEDIMMNIDRDMPEISFSDRVQDLMTQTMQNTVVVRMLGRNIGYRMLYNRIMSLWKPNGNVKVVDLDNGYFLVRLSCMEDYTAALLNGPWSIMGHYLVVQPWTPSFNTKEENLSAIAAWVRFPGLPIQYYHKSILRAIASMVGKFIKIDYNTGTSQRGKFARMAVELDLHKPLVSKICIDGRIQCIEYEDLPFICYKCGRYGHISDMCKFKTEINFVKSGNISPEKSTVIQEDDRNQSQTETATNKLGPWIHATKRGRKNQFKEDNSSNNKSSKAQIEGNYHTRFNILADMEEDFNDGNNRDDNGKNVASAQMESQNKWQSKKVFSKGENSKKVQTLYKKSQYIPKPKQFTTILNAENPSPMGNKENSIPNVDQNPIVSQPSHSNKSQDRLKPDQIEKAQVRKENKLDPQSHSVIVLEHPLSTSHSFGNIPQQDGLVMQKMSILQRSGHLGRPPDKSKQINLKSKLKFKQSSLRKIGDNQQNKEELLEDMIFSNREDNLPFNDDEEIEVVA